MLIASALLSGDAPRDRTTGSPRDRADRIIAATAQTFGYRVITRDDERVPHAVAGHIAVTAC